MLQHIGREAAPRLDAVPILARLAQRMVALERKLRVDDDAARRVRQGKQAVGPRPVAERRLESIGGGRQRVAHLVGKLRLTERAARLLVREHFLQADHVGGELGDIFLRLADDREAFLEVAHGVGRVDRLLVQRLGDPQADLVEPLVQGAQQQPFLRLHPFGQTALRHELAFRELAQPAGQLGLRLCEPLGRVARRIAPPPEQNQQGEQDQNGRRRQNRRQVQSSYPPDDVAQSQPVHRPFPLSVPRTRLAGYPSMPGTASGILGLDAGRLTKYLAISFYEFHGSA